MAGSHTTRHVPAAATSQTTPTTAAQKTMHDTDGQELCRHYSSRGTCKFNARCFYRHLDPVTGAVHPTMCPPPVQQLSQRHVPNNSGYSDEEDEDVDDMDQCVNTMIMHGLRPWNPEDWDALGRIQEMHDQQDAADYDSDDGGIMGFSHDDVMDLAAQGIKPWDDDAYGALSAMRGFY